MTPRLSNARLWPGMIFVLIGANMCIVAITVYAAHFRHASFAVEPDYDSKALHWDDTARQLRHNVDLGWKVQVISADAGQFSIVAIDKQGRPLEGASIRVEAFHHAHASDKINVTLSPAVVVGRTVPGRYATAADIGTPGFWEFRFTIKRGPETFTQSVTCTVPRRETEPLP